MGKYVEINIFCERHVHLMNIGVSTCVSVYIFNIYKYQVTSTKNLFYNLHKYDKLKTLS